MASPITFSGAASGLDTQAIVEALLTFKKQKVQGINDRISAANRQKSALSDLKSTLSSLKSAADGLDSSVFGVRKTTLSDDTYFTASADSEASLGNYDIAVDTVAQRSVAKIGDAVSLSTEIATGAASITLNLRDGATHTLNFAAGTTLNDVRDAINNDDTINDDLEATLIQTETDKYQLVVTSKDLGDNQTILDVDNKGAMTASSVSGFIAGFTAVNTNGVDTTLDGKDAHFFINGVEITRTTNDITDAVDGVSLKLVKGEEVGSSDPNAYSQNQTLKIETDFDQIISGIKNFVDKFNAARTKLNSLSNSEGLLSGDSGLRSLHRELASIVTGVVENVGVLNQRDGGADGFESLSQIGFKTDSKTGALSFDSNTLKEALEDHFDEVKNLFLGNQSSSNSNISLLTNTGRAFSGSVVLDLNNLTATIDGTNYTLEKEGNSFTLANLEDDSELEGLIFYSETGGGTATLEISSGLGAVMSDSVGDYSDFDGLLNDRSGSITELISGLNDSLDTAQLRVDNERTRLTAIFARSEQAISQLQALQASLGGQIR